MIFAVQVSCSAVKVVACAMVRFNSLGKAQARLPSLTKPEAAAAVRYCREARNTVL